MRNIEAVFLFVTRPTPALQGLRDRLNRQIACENATFWAVLDDKPGVLVLEAEGLRLTVTTRHRPLPAQDFDGALDALLSEAHKGVLADILHRHGRHMAITLTRLGKDADRAGDWLRMLRIAHAATGILAELHQPAAVHWRQSNQILLGAQYLQLVPQPEPWALFARAVATGTLQLQVDPPAPMQAGPIVVSPAGQDMAHALAAALSYLRHRAHGGAAIADGHSFGPIGHVSARIRHIPTGDGGAPPVLHMTLNETPFFVSDRARGKSPGVSTAGALAALQDALGRRGKAERAAERRNLTAGAIATALMPPLGLMLVALNQLGGLSILRSGLIAVATLGLALGLVSGAGFDTGARSAASLAPEQIQQSVLAAN